MAQTGYCFACVLLTLSVANGNVLTLVDLVVEIAALSKWSITIEVESS